MNETRSLIVMAITPCAGGLEQHRMRGIVGDWVTVLEASVGTTGSGHCPATDYVKLRLLAAIWP